MTVCHRSGSASLRDARVPVPYGAAKAAIALLTQHVAAQAGPYAIRAARRPAVPVARSEGLEPPAF